MLHAALLLSNCLRRLSAYCSGAIVRSRFPMPPSRQYVLIFACAVVVAAAFSIAASAQTADLVVLNGKVFTATERSSLEEGFAIRDGRFIAVGTSGAMRRHIGGA